MRRKWWIWVLLVVVVAVAAGGVWRWATRNRAETVTYEQAVVKRADVSEVVFGSGTASPASQTTIRTGKAGTVTAIALAEGDTIAPGDELFRINGSPVFALGGEVPFYRTLRGGEQGDDVTALQEMLTALGFYDADIDGEYGWRTQDAVEEFLESRGEERTSVVGPDTFQAVGRDAIVADVAIARGDLVQAGAPALVVVADEPLEAVLDVNEIDISAVKTGQKVEITVDALPGQTFQGTVTRVSTGLVEAAAGGLSAGSAGKTSAGVVNFPVTVTFNEVVPGLKSGMSVSADIIVAQSTDVLVVPLSALIEEDGRTSVLVPPASTTAEQSGRARTDPLMVAVEVGLRSDALAEIRSGLTEGQIIITKITVADQGSASAIFPSGFTGGRARSVNQGVQTLGGED